MLVSSTAVMVKPRHPRNPLHPRPTFVICFYTLLLPLTLLLEPATPPLHPVTPPLLPVTPPLHPVTPCYTLLQLWNLKV